VVPGAAQDAVRADRKVAQIFRDAHETYSTFRRIYLPDVDRGHGVRLHRLQDGVDKARATAFDNRLFAGESGAKMPASCAIMTPAIWRSIPGKM
jgi:hypothetical protein